MTSSSPVIPPVKIDFDDDDRSWICSRIDEVLMNGRLTMGPYGEEFEQAFAQLTGAKHAIAVNSGTSALEIMLRGIDVAGRDVLIPAITFVATASAVIAAGGQPVLMDTDRATMSTTPEEIAKRLTTNTAAVIIVHIAGVMTHRLPEIADLCQDRGIALFEDAAHAHGSTLNDRHAGTFGLAGSFSFYPTKVMTSAEGGMIVTDDDQLADEARILRDQGKASFLENRAVRIGNNWRMSEPHAIIGLRHLMRLPEMLRDRRKVAVKYDEAFNDWNKGLWPLLIPGSCRSNYYKYVCFLSEESDRANFKAYLKDRHAVTCSGEVYDNAVHMNPAFKHLARPGLGNAEMVAKRHICLPIFSKMEDEQVEQVIEAVKAANSDGIIS